MILKGMVAYTAEKITHKELDELENDFDPMEAPPGPYKLQPENQGRMNEENSQKFNVTNI